MILFFTTGTPVTGNRKFIPFKHTGQFITPFADLLIPGLYKPASTLNLKLIERPDIIYIMIAGKGIVLVKEKNKSSCQRIIEFQKDRCH